MLKMKKIEKEKKRKQIRAYFQRSMGYLFWRQVCLSVHTPGVLFYTSHIDVSRKENQALCNEIEELKNKLQKVTDDLSKINMADTPNGNCHQEKRIQLNLCQANMATSSASKWKLRGKFRSSSQELRKFQFCAIILGNLSKPQKHTVINSTLRSVVSGDKDVYIMGDFKI